MTATEPPGTAPGQTVLATIDPNSDVLVASPAIVQYEIAAGTTCAPNCSSSPGQSGDPSRCRSRRLGAVSVEVTRGRSSAMS